MPLIFFSTLLQLIVLFYRDKILSKFFPLIKLVFKLYFHYSQFESTLHLYARKLTEYIIPIMGFLIIWVFGNEFYFPSLNIQNLDKIEGKYSEDGKSFIPSTDTEFEINNTGYIANFERRASTTGFLNLSSPLCYFTQFISLQLT